jgi:apolipoprotein N-acyltransferase
MAFFFPLLSWTSTQVGQVPWIVLSLLEALYFALLGGAGALSSRLADRHRTLWPVVIGVLWVAQEALRDRTPFGGFPWGRLAFSQSNSWLGRFAWLGGAPLVSFAVAVCGGLLVTLAWRRWQRPTAANLRRPLMLAAAAVLVVLVGLVVPTWTTAPQGRTMTVAVVQGNVPRLGLEFNEQRRRVLDNHVKATLRLADDVEHHRRPRPDVVVWPENSSDIDPTSNGDAAEEISRAAKKIGAPIVVGTMVRDKVGNQNISLVWDPKTGPGFKYVKQHPVPFAEYIPIKGFVRTVAGFIDQRMVDGIDRVVGFKPGKKPGVIPVAGTKLSGIICFEVAYDDLVRSSVTNGAQIIAVQTNNATFNNAEATQQMAMVRLRSVEHGRDGLMASTVGVSGFTDSSGAVYDETSFNTPKVLVRTFHLGEATTPATAMGMLPELLGCVAALGVLIAAGWLRGRTLDGVAGGDTK